LLKLDLFADFPALHAALIRPQLEAGRILQVLRPEVDIPDFEEHKAGF